MDARELALLSELAKMMQELSDEGVNAEDVLLGTRTALLEKKKASEKEKELEKGKENKVTTNKIRVYEHLVGYNDTFYGVLQKQMVSLSSRKSATHHNT